MAHKLLQKQTQMFVVCRCKEKPLDEVGRDDKRVLG